MIAAAEGDEVSDFDPSLICYVDGRIWLKKYAVHYAGCDLFARMSIVRLENGDLLLHSPSPTDEETVREVSALGRVAHIVAPGSYHYFHVGAWQKAFPDASVWICPGVERKLPDLDFDGFLSDHSPDAWASEMDQVLVRGNRLIWEVAFLDRESKTLILTDLVENIGPRTDGVNWVLKLWWKVVMDMWDKPKPAPEYQMGWKDRAAARRGLERILAWDIERVVVAHGENIEENVQAVLRTAWSKPLAWDA